MTNSSVQAAYDRIMRLASGPLCDQKISLYATCEPKFACRLPPLSHDERCALLAQIKPPLLANPKATDRVLCNLVVRTWAREMAAKAMPQIKQDLHDDYWNGDPETAESLLGRLARRLHLR